MKTLTKSWLQQQIAEMESARDEIPFGLGVDGDNTIAAFKLALASMEAEPVGEFYEASPGNWYQRSDGDKAPKWTPLYTVQPSPVVPEVLPCSVLLEPGMRFGKGVLTQTMLDALQRRAEYYSELEEMTPEQRAEHEAGIAEFKSMFGTPAPVVQDDGRTDFEDWMLKQWGRNREPHDFILVPTISGKDYGDSYTRCMWKSWKACRAAMLQSGNSPVTPDGWVMVPAEPTDKQWAAGMQAFTTGVDKVSRVYKAMLAAAQQHSSMRLSVAKSSAERKAAQRARQAESGERKLELMLDYQELEMLARNCATRRPGRAPYEVTEYVAMLIRQDDARVRGHIKSISANRCGKCGDSLPVESCPCAGDSTCWVTLGWHEMKLTT